MPLAARCVFSLNAGPGPAPIPTLPLINRPRPARPTHHALHTCACRLDAPHNWTDLPLFEVPAYRLPGGNKRMDPMPAAGMSILQRLRADFERKRGSGVPVPVLTHIAYLSTP